jgi:hypothetical protein
MKAANILPKDFFLKICKKIDLGLFAAGRANSF